MENKNTVLVNNINESHMLSESQKWQNTFCMIPFPSILKALIIPLPKTAT